MIVFDRNKANEWKSVLQKLARDFEECELRLNALMQGIDMQVSARGEIDLRLKNLRSQARNLRESLEAMSAFLSKAETAYSDADGQIVRMVNSLVSEWQESERKLAPIVSRTKIGLAIEDVERLDAAKMLDGFFMGDLLTDFENHTAFFKPLDVKFEILQ